jgi:hypothetical protein
MGVRRPLFVLFGSALSACMNWSLAPADASTDGTVDATTDATDAQGDAGTPISCAAALASAKEALDQALICANLVAVACNNIAAIDECGCNVWVQDGDSGASDTYRRRMAQFVDAGCDAACGAAGCAVSKTCTDVDGSAVCQ